MTCIMLLEIKLKSLSEVVFVHKLISNASSMPMERSSQPMERSSQPMEVYHSNRVPDVSSFLTHM